MRMQFNKMMVCMALVAGILFTGTGQPLAAQDQATGITAEQVLDGHVKAIGGADKLKSFETRVTKATLSMPQVGLTGPMTITQKAPNLYRLEIDLPGVGNMLQICDGKDVMDNNPLMGKRMLSGGEKESVMIEASFNAEANWRKTYKSVSYAGKEDVGGAPCHKVVAELASGAKRTMYYDAATGLLKKIKAVVSSPQGELATESIIEDYKEVDGVKYAYKTTVSVLGQQQVVEIDSIEHDAEVDAETFTIPKS